MANTTNSLFPFRKDSLLTPTGIKTVTSTESQTESFFCYSKPSSHKILTNKEKHSTRAFFIWSSRFCVVLGPGGQKIISIWFLVMGRLVGRCSRWLWLAWDCCWWWLIVDCLFVCTGVFSVASLRCVAVAATVRCGKSPWHYLNT